MKQLLAWTFALLCGFCASASAADQPQRNLRVMSYNIHHGEGLDAKIDLERIAQVIKDAKADLVGLQEVDRGATRSQKRDLAKELAELTGMHYYFAKNIPHQGGEYGNAILSRFPIIASTNLHYKMLRTGEQRGLLQITLEAFGNTITFFNTHLDHRPDPSERLENVKEIQKAVAEAKGAVIIVGDFNSTPESETQQRLREFLTDTWKEISKEPGYTFSSKNPNKRIDYIYTNEDSGLKPIQGWIPRTEASDHLPLVVEFAGTQRNASGK